MAKVASNAAEMLAEGELNRFFIRGLCICMTAADVNAEVEIYRAKEVEKPRSESQMRIGKRVRASALLNDLRQNIAVDTALGVPAGPNSGLSVRAIR